VPIITGNTLIQRAPLGEGGRKKTLPLKPETAVNFPGKGKEIPSLVQTKVREVSQFRKKHPGKYGQMKGGTFARISHYPMGDTGNHLTKDSKITWGREKMKNS